MSPPLRISLVVPNLNSGKQLERCLRSVFEQDDPNLQLIIADAGSTDASRDTIERFADRFDVVLDRDDGQADGLNRGFRRADGDLHGWLCADDELLPGALGHVRSLFDANPETAIITGACERVFADGQPWTNPGHPDPWSVIDVQNVIEQPSTFWRAAWHRKVGELDQSFHLAFDWDLWIRLRNAGAVMQTTDYVLSRYFFSEDNKSGSAGNLFVEEAYRLVHRYGPWRGNVARLFRFLYWKFDLPGCLDKPPSASLPRRAAFAGFCAAVVALGGRKWLKLYNWHFASQQQRGLRWW